MEDIKIYNKTINSPVSEKTLMACLCPISHQLFLDPYVAEDGFTYEKECLEIWFEKAVVIRSPKTNLEMGKTIRQNIVIRTLVGEIVSENNGFKEYVYSIRIKPQRILNCRTSLMQDKSFFDLVDKLVLQDDLNETDKNGNSLLHFIVCHGNLKKIEYLLKNGSDPSINNKNGEDCFSFSFKHSSKKIAHRMVGEYRKRAIALSPISLKYAYDIAFHQPLSVLYNFLEEVFFDINIVDKKGLTLFDHLCFQRCDPVVVQKLLQAGLNINTKRGKLNETTFLKICEKQPDEIIQICYDHLLKNKEEIIKTCMHSTFTSFEVDVTHKLSRNKYLNEIQIEKWVKIFENKSSV